MKYLKMLVCFSVSLFMLIGCTDSINKTSTNDKENNEIKTSLEKEVNENTPENKLNESDEVSSNTIDQDQDHTMNDHAEPVGNNEESNGALSEYSSEQIEYARVWLQLGPNQDLDALYVRHIPAGELLHPEDETSIGYPEDVIQLSGTRLVDGSVTYSGNGDGTINVYKVPLRWDGVYPAGEEFYQEMIDNTELVSIDPGEDEEVIALIKLLND